MSITAPLAPTAPKRFRRRITTLLVGLAAMLALPGTAFAYTQPVTSGSGSVTAPIRPLTAAPSTGSSMGSVLAALAVAVLAVAIVIVAQRVLRRRSETPRPIHA